MKILPLKRLLISLLLLIGLNKAYGSEVTTLHHVSMFLGAGTEEKGDHHESISAVGLDYSYRIDKQWSLGIETEFLGHNNLRDKAIIFPISWYIDQHWTVFTGPGHEWIENESKYLWRLGAGYSFHLNQRWNITPQVLVDFIERGEQTWLTGITIGYHF